METGRVFLREKTKFNKETEIILLINPSKEKTSIEEISTEIFLLISKISSEKQIFLLKRSSPKFLIAKETLEKISKNCDNKK